MARDTYAELFNARGHQYHAAMSRFPHARDAEFQAAIDVSGVRGGERVADIPCGGGYLANYLPAGVELYSVDSSDVFADCFRQSGGHRLLQCPITAVPLPDGTLDHVISVAGLHHVEDRTPFWRECARLLRPGGTLTVADVRLGSPAALFLDSTVDRYTATGHRGIYFDARTCDDLAACGFRPGLCEARRIGWRTGDLASLAAFCLSLFGLEGISTDELARILVRDIGVREVAGGVELDWELQFYRATRA